MLFMNPLLPLRNELQNIVVEAGITAHNEDNEVLMRMNSSPDPG